MDSTNSKRRATRNGANGSPKLPLGSLYERAGKCGRRYLVGRLGMMKLLVVSTGETSRGNPVWECFLTEGPYVSDAQRALAQEIDSAGAP